MQHGPAIVDHLVGVDEQWWPLRTNDQWLIDLEDGFLGNEVRVSAPRIHHEVAQINHRQSGFRRLQIGAHRRE
jgi:hypothetical protein